MKRHCRTGLTALALTVGAVFMPSAASAQAAQAAQSAPAVPAGGGAVRVHVRTFKDKGTARLFIRRPDGTYDFVCASPCTADMPVNSVLRATLANNDDEPHTFVVSGDLGPEVDLEVRPASAGPLIGGIVMMGSGGALVLSGLLLVAISGIDYTTRTTSSNTAAALSGTYKTIGYVFMGLGAAVAVGGLVWLLTRSHEPKVLDSPHRAPDVYGRAETLLGDVAVAKRRDATTATTSAPAVTPLELRFTF
jgi:hypothetical protein